MKNQSISITFLVFAFSLFIFSSCKDKNAASTPESNTELQASATYQCPMDCEDGKTYNEPGSCPVCKMDLKEVNKGNAMTCSQHKDGKCSCEGAKCKCDNCPEHKKAMSCSMHKDGKCNCEGDKCKCANCPEHSKAMTCITHKDGKCSCEGDKCKCANCPTHT